MSFMNFPRDSAKTAKAKRLNTRALATPKQYDWEILAKHGLTEVFEDQLVWRHGNGFIDDDLLKLFKNEQPVYKELVVEFLASFKMDDSEIDDTFNIREIVTFRLAGIWHTMRLIDFGIHLGLQDPATDRDQYHHHLSQSTIGEAPDFNLQTFWREISMVEYDPKNSREAHLRNPLLRIIHRYLAWTILYNAQAEKINEAQIKGLHYCMHRGNRWNIPYAMALMFRAAQRGEPQKLPGGQFITTIASSLNLLNPSLLRSFAGPAKREVKGYNFMTASMILKSEDGSYRPYRDFEPKPGMEDIIMGSQGAGASSGPSSSRQTRRRTSERREREEVPINLAYVARQNDRLGYYNDDIQRMVMQLGQGVQQLMAHSGLPPPEFQGYKYWDERMGYPQARQDQGGDGDEEEEEGDGDDE